MRETFVSKMIFQLRSTKIAQKVDNTKILKPVLLAMLRRVSMTLL